MKQSVLERSLKELAFNIEMLAQTNESEEELLMYVRQLDDLITSIHFYGVKDDKTVDLNSLMGDVPNIFKKWGDS